MLLWVVVKRTQLTKLVRERNQGANISMSAIKAGMSRNTARNYLRQEDVMEQRQAPHTWRTREDPLEEVWPRALAMLREAPELEAKALFEYLAQSHPGGIKDKLLRTFQRRVRSCEFPPVGRRIGLFLAELTPCQPAKNTALIRHQCSTERFLLLGTAVNSGFAVLLGLC